MFSRKLSEAERNYERVQLSLKLEPVKWRHWLEGGTVVPGMNQLQNTGLHQNYQQVELMANQQGIVFQLLTNSCNSKPNALSRQFKHYQNIIRVIENRSVLLHLIMKYVH